MMRKAFLYRAYLNKPTQENCEKVLWQCCGLWNLMLLHRNDIYDWGLKFETTTRNAQLRMITQLKKTHPAYLGFPYGFQEDIAIRVDRAFDAFFKRCKRKKNGEKIKAGYPKTKTVCTSFGFYANKHKHELCKNTLIVDKVGTFKLRLHRPIRGRIKQITISVKNDKWYVSFSCDNVPQENTYPYRYNSIGISMGYSCFLMDSEGNSVPFPAYYHKAEKRLQRLNRALSRKKKGSSRWRAAKKTLSTRHSEIANCRRYFFYKIANSYVENYDVIRVGKFDIQNMIQQATARKMTKRVKNILDAAWGTFVLILKQKAIEHGKVVEEIESQYTSMTCNKCGARKEIDYSEIEYVCDKCGHTEHRKLNAAKNILAAHEGGSSMSRRCQAI